LPATPALRYSPLVVYINEERIEVLVKAIVKALGKQGFVHAKVPERDLVARIHRIFIDNLLEEQALEEEAEKMADKLARHTSGMDQRRIVLGIKQRLAKERGFTL
jgi:hypothetical protein